MSRVCPFTIAAVTVSMVVVMVPQVVVAQPFEGALTMRLSAKGANGLPVQEVEYLVRGGKVRVSMNGPAGAMSLLSVPQEQKVYVLMASQNAYMEMPIAEASSSVAAATPGNFLQQTRVVGIVEPTRVGLEERPAAIAVGFPPELPAVAHRPESACRYEADCRRHVVIAADADQECDPRSEIVLEGGDDCRADRIGDRRNTERHVGLPLAQLPQRTRYSSTVGPRKREAAHLG